MHNRMPSRRRPAASNSTVRQGDTLPSQGQTETQEPVPRLPHERDESADSQPAGSASATRKGRQAHDDLERGRLDTDKGPVMDRTYDRVREGADKPKKKFSP